MAIQLTKIKADGGVNYLLNTIANDQPGLDFEAGTTPQPGSTRMDYYTAAGTPPGVWMGQGCAALGVKAGTRASRNQVVNLYSKLHHPITGSELTKRSDAARTNSVSGYDLTFEAPKSVSLLWALGDDHTRRTVLACHYEAIERTLDWWQREVAVTRVGAGGIAHSPVEGITAVRFDHWDTREHDPHLHSHVAISNLALREDGQWATLDGRVVYRAQVAASETHANILRDLLHDRLGVAFEEHPNEGRSNSKAVVLDVAGIPKELIDRFSKRSIQTDRIHRELLDRWRKEHGREPDYRTQARLREQAFQRGRKAKDTHALSLAELSRQWHEECAELGFDPAAICEQSLAHDECAVNANDSANTHELARQITGQQSWQAAISEITRNATSNATTISRWQLHAEIERLTSRIRCIPETRAHLTEQLVELATRDLIPINPHRYQIPEHHVHDTRIADTLGHANVDNARLDRWATRHLLDAEEYLKSLAAEQGTHPDPRLNAMVSEAIGLHEQRTVEAGGHRMADDQRQAATRLACSTATISALTGPAGTGKTTTMRAVKEALDNTLGPGKVMGMATGAKAAGELAASLDIATNTVAKILYEHCDSDGYYIRRRAKLIAELSAKPALSGKQRAWMNQLISEQQAVAIPEQGVVIVDEASMTSTMDLTRLAQLCARHGSRMILTGDPHQLDAPGEGGGFLGWMEDEHLDHRLTSVWRFNNPEETVATLALRDGRSDPGTHGRDAVPAATGMYMRLDGPEHPWENTDPNHCGRLHGGDSDDMEAAVYQHTLDGLLNGRDTLMIVATNDSLDRINARMSLELQARGLVDPDPAWRVPTCEGLDCGIGDTIITRSNDRRNRYNGDDFVKNGDLWLVTGIDQNGITVTHKHHPNTLVRLSLEYCRTSVELGYAVTAHRAQGVTVETANLYIPEGQGVPRELLYVAMTRGRARNDCWIGTPPVDQLKETHEWANWIQRNRERLERSGHAYSDQDLEPTPIQMAAASFTGMIRNSQAPVMASTQIEQNRLATHSLDRLLAERSLFADMIITPTLTSHLEKAHGTAVTSMIRDSAAWDSIVNQYTRAIAVDEQETLRIINHQAADTANNPIHDLDGQLFDMIEPEQLAYDLTMALRHVWQDQDSPHDWLTPNAPPIALTENETPEQHSARVMLDQADTLIHQRIQDMVQEVMPEHGDQRPTWAKRMSPPPRADHPRHEQRHQQWLTLMRDITLYRHQHRILADTPLGPPPENNQYDDQDPTARRDWIRLADRIVEYRDDLPQGQCAALRQQHRHRTPHTGPDPLQATAQWNTQQVDQQTTDTTPAKHDTAIQPAVSTPDGILDDLHPERGEYLGDGIARTAGGIPYDPMILTDAAMPAPHTGQPVPDAGISL